MNLQERQQQVNPDAIHSR